tara:strand:- start:50 stop:322 length:273 start_codon:yes stop_codon:yes gene_type:complete
MTQKQLIEIVQIHHPEMSETQIRLYLNQALDEFCRKTEILKTQSTITSTANKRYYDLDSFGKKFIKIERVEFDKNEISQLSGRPDKYSNS